MNRQMRSTGRTRNPRTLPAFAAALLALAALLFPGCSSVPESTLAVIGGDTLRVPEYETMYLRSRMQEPENPAQAEQFLDLLVNFRVKLKEAESRGLQLDPSFQSELAQYRDQIAVSYLLDKELVTPALRTLYERRKDEVYFAHILVKNKRTPFGATDTAATREAALQLLEGVRSSTEPFDTLIEALSEDAQKERTHGHVGWLIAGTTFPELDDVVYSIPVGEIAPTLLKSPFGYHIVKLLGRKPARQRVRASHILYRLDINNPTDTAAGYARLSLVLDSLKRGKANFEDLARRNSMDPVSGAKGGDLGWLDRGTNLEQRFEEALFNVAKGEVSPVVRSTFGLHLIKVTDEDEPRPFTEARNDLLEIYRRERYADEYRAYTKALREKNGFIISPDVVRMIVSRVDTAWTTSTPGWERRLTDRDLDAFLFRLTDLKYTVREAVGAIRGDASLQMKRFIPRELDSIAIRLADRIVLARETRDYENTEAEFARLMTEYRESALVSQLEQSEVIEHVTVPDEALRSYWEKHKDEFAVPERVNFSEIFVLTREHARALLDSLSIGTDFNELAARQTRRPAMMEKAGRWGFEPVTLNKLTEEAARLPIGAVSAPIVTDEGVSLIRVDGKDIERLKTFEEARPEIIGMAKEQAVTEALTRWAESLRGKFDVQIYPEHLDNAFSKER